MMIRRSSMRAAVRSMVRDIGSALTLLVLSGAYAPASLSAATPTTQELVQQLRAGGFVLVMRHAQSPDEVPTAGEADPGNVHLERQLSAAGKASARELGRALHELGIPIGQIYASPTYRAMQTVQLAGLANPQAVPQLSEGAQGMRGKADRARVLWLQAAVRQAPPAGTNTLVVTHTPNIVGAFGSPVANIAAGEMLVFRPQGTHAAMVGRIAVAQWRRLAAH